MKPLNSIYQKMCDRGKIRKAIVQAALGKRHRREVQKVLANKEYYVGLIYDILINEDFTPSKYRTFERCDGASRKRRTIVCINFFPDQIIHWLLILALKDRIINSSYRYSCGCMPRRGVHYGMKYVKRIIKKNRKNTKYVAKLDISKYYPSIPHDKLKQSLRKLTKDKRVLKMLDVIIDSYPNGIPIGYLTSQWFSNYYLQGLDNFIKQELEVKYYIRYMDDMVLFGSNKRKLHKQVKLIEDYLANLGLKLNNKTQVFPLKSRALDFMGFRFYRNKVTIRKAILIRITRAIRRYFRCGSIKHAASILSYIGWFRCTDTYNVFRKYILKRIKVKTLKRKVGNFQSWSNWIKNLKCYCACS